MRNITSVFALVALTAVASPAVAQDAVRKPYMFGLTANHMSIDPTTASTQFVGAQSWGMQVDAAYTFGKHVIVSGDLGPQFLSDKAGFTQNTTAGEKQSTATLMYYSAMAGLRSSAYRVVPGIAPISLGLFGGVSKTSGERSIDNCVDCTSQDIKVEGGSFVQPTLVFGEGKTRMRISDRYFVDGKGIRQVISLGMELGGL